MKMEPVTVHAGRMLAFSGFAAGFALVVPCVILLGWILDVQVMKGLLPGVKPMNPASAVAFMVLGLALQCARNRERVMAGRVAVALALLVAAAGAVRAAGYALTFDPHFDTWLFHDSLGTNRMAPLTSVAFVLVGLALSMSVGRGARPIAEILLVPPMLISLLALLGYGYQIRSLYAVGTFSPMSLHTAIMFQVLAMGILALRPDLGLMRVISGETGGGRMARHLLPASVVILCVLGWVRLQGERRGLYGSETGLAFFMIANVVLLGWLILRNARHLADADGRRDEVAADLRLAREELERRVVERTGELSQVIAELTQGIAMLLEVARDVMTAGERLTMRAGESAAVVAQTASTVEEVRQTARMTTRESERVAAHAQHAAQVSQEGKKATEETVLTIQHIRGEMDAIAGSMMRLNDQTQTISQIIATVNAIASQSNLLAVNAAIEAAKAGERGKGFSVVAREVRTLADQSRRATRQVSTILSDIQRATHLAVMAIEHGRKAVESGVAQSVRSGAAIERLAAGVSEAAEAVAHVAGTSQQQMQGVDQVAVAMETMKQDAIHSVTSARQLEAAAQHLTDLGQKLHRLVIQYKS